MKMGEKPETKLGKWSVGWQIFFVIVVAASLILVLVLGVLNFDDHWWDVTVPVLILVSIVAFFAGINCRNTKQRPVYSCNI